MLTLDTSNFPLFLYKKRHDIIMERIMNVKDENEIDLNIFIKFLNGAF
jgi:hypothetical protein